MQHPRCGNAGTRAAYAALEAAIPPIAGPYDWRHRPTSFAIRIDGGRRPGRVSYCTLRHLFRSWSTITAFDFRNGGSWRGTGSTLRCLHQHQLLVFDRTFLKYIREVLIGRRIGLEPFSEAVGVGDEFIARLLGSFWPVMEEPALALWSAQSTNDWCNVDVHVVAVIDGDTASPPLCNSIVPRPRLPPDRLEHQVQRLVGRYVLWQTELRYQVEVETRPS